MSCMPAGPSDLSKSDFDKAARCGEPSYVWRTGQQRRLDLILDAAGDLINGVTLENGCGVGMYVEHLSPSAAKVIGLEFDLDRSHQAAWRNHSNLNTAILCAAGEALPFPEACFDFILSHEVLEHVEDDRQSVREMVRTLRPRGRMVIFVPNRGYPFETHGIYWRGVYRFGNIPLVNYLPGGIRDQLAPHVRIYTSRDLLELFHGLPVRFEKRTVIFGAYDNIISRRPGIGKALRALLQFLEKTPFKVFGLSHFWIVEKIDER
jgi:SAM-dependent methyltransferase